ncbi:MAG: sigma 54-interacting transcriptional regulator [Syntrophomonadaceae bacterium]|nr:sigma 54-interacting transcriptional regulator [Syntrophomonadaceae bacterium]
MEIIIDEHCVEVIPGETILELAQRSGIYIPNLCSSNGICCEKGLCRLCVVEIKTSSGVKLVESCSYKIAEEMKVRTSTPLIEGIRHSILNLFIGKGDLTPGDLAELINFAEQHNSGIDETGYALFVSAAKELLPNIFQKGLEDNPQLAYIIVNKEGIIQEINQTYLDIMGIDINDALGEYILDVVPNSELLKILETGHTDQAAFWTVNGHDSIVNRVPIVRDGQIVGALGYSLFLDMSAARIFIKTMQEREKEFNDFLQGLLENPYLAYTIVDRNGYITAINQATLDILQLEKGDAMGKYILEVMPNSEFPEILKTGRIDRAELYTTNGRDTIVNRMPITQDGEIIGAVAYSLFLDMSGAKLLTRRLQEMEKQLTHYKGEINDIYRAKWIINDLVGNSPAFSWIRNVIGRMSFTTSTVLITGESGTGKEIVAQAIHNSSHLKHGPFIRVNCVALPENLLESELFGYEEGAFTGARKGGKPGKFELASGGTIFLDEIGDMPLTMQTKLLSVLQEKVIERIGGTKPIPIDVRVIAATNRDLEEMVAEGQFREDLYYRLNVVRLDLPPLRNRMDDLPLLVNDLIKRINKKLGTNITGISPQAMEQLESYAWPGNVRELENLLERAVNLAFMNQETFLNMTHFLSLFKSSLGDSIQMELGESTLPDTLEKIERDMINEALAKTGGNKNRAAKMLGIHISALYRRLDKYVQK